MSYLPMASRYMGNSTFFAKTILSMSHGSITRSYLSTFGAHTSKNDHRDSVRSSVWTRLSRRKAFLRSTAWML